MRKYNKNYVVLVLLLLLITLGFATLSTTLSINGTTKIKGNTWDVHFENVVVTDGSVEANDPVISNKTSIDFEVQLDKPGDFYEFTVDVVNAGTIDAMIEKINKTNLTSEQSIYLDYTVIGIKEKNYLAAKKSKTVTVRVEFNDIEVNQLPSNPESITLNLSFDAVQADETAVKDIVLNDLNSNGIIDVGDKVCVQTECFYVISNTDGEVRALAEWNLLVGNQYDGSNTTPLANPTGLQDNSAKGLLYAEGTGTEVFPLIGTTAFSSSSYWNGVSGETIHLTNNSNLINGYLNSYKNSLSSMGLEVNEVTLITKSELENLGCGSSCMNAPSWVYQTSYWSRSATSPSFVWVVGNSGGFYSSRYYLDDNFGVRPVIAFDESLLSE